MLDRRRHRLEGNGLLLAATAAAFFVEGIGSARPGEQILVSALLSVTLLLALWTADARPWIMRGACLVAAAVIATTVIEVAVNGNEEARGARVAGALLVALAPPAVILGVVRDLRAKRRVTLEAVLGVLSVYILIGMFFAFVFGALNQIGGENLFAGGGGASISKCLYFSFTTLTTVGYGDVTTRTNLGHTLSSSEALLGQIYLVTVVSLIVANLGRGRPTDV